MDAWKMWVILGLGLQVFGVIPAAVLILTVEETVYKGEGGATGDTGIPVRETYEPGRREWWCVLTGFLLVSAGAACQIVGVVVSP